MKLNETKIREMGEALQKYQRGESLTDGEMAQARDFAELLTMMSGAHPDCKVFRFYNPTAQQLNEFLRARKTKR